MKVHRFEDASEFYQQVKDYLLSNEAQHCLLLSIVNTLIVCDWYDYSFTEDTADATAS